ncbi:hypothetical protein BSZ35_04445 [Salinibacter sp. 10B]|uniref:hypothetical protein n=1 Tax=Salinibacter sp. 10B TaxID=1923971 RepID=UPI000CF48E46|nr:hypothetical protein [Salinibacter sp. 10B]PQJ33958.1 hypothetical protein BSZ35_04445 [Salinibacter sp. 10B]
MMKNGLLDGGSVPPPGGLLERVVPRTGHLAGRVERTGCFVEVCLVADHEEVGRKRKGYFCKLHKSGLERARLDAEADLFECHFFTDIQQDLDPRTGDDLKQVVEFGRETLGSEFTLWQVAGVAVFRPHAALEPFLQLGVGALL